MSILDREEKLRLSVLKKYYPKLIAKELVSVQPMTVPIAKAFPYTNFPYEQEEFFTEEEFNL